MKMLDSSFTCTICGENTFITEKVYPLQMNMSPNNGIGTQTGEMEGDNHAGTQTSSNGKVTFLATRETQSVPR